MPVKKSALTENDWCFYRNTFRKIKITKTFLPAKKHSNFFLKTGKWLTVGSGKSFYCLFFKFYPQPQANFP